MIFVQIIVTPLLNITDKELYLVSFLEEKEHEIRAIGAIINDDETENIKTKELEFELKSTKEHLQTVIEELETSNEEMQSLNEELQSSNEELQSSNEELETSNEELQSSNEELQTAYSELDHSNKEIRLKSQELEKANTLLEKKKQKLLLSTKRFETAIESTDGGIFEYYINNPKKGFLSAKFAKILGYAKNEISSHERDIQSFILNAIEKEQIEKYQHFYTKFLQEKKLFDMIVKLQTKEEGYKHFHLSCKYIQIEKEVKIVGILIDVDQKHKDTIELRVQKQKLDTIFASVDNMILIHNKQEQLIEVNEAFQRYFGKDLVQFQKEHRSICELFCQQKDDPSYLFFENSYKKRWIEVAMSSQSDHKVKIQIGEDFYHFKIIFKKIDINDTQTGYLITLNDITPQVVYEEKLRENVDKQVEQLRQKDEMLLSQSKSAAMGEMISAIAHQWRQPLNTLSLLNIALENKETIDQKTLQEFREKSNQVILQMSQTIDDFRDFFKPNKSKERFFVKESISKILDLLKPQLEAHNITIENTVCEKTTLINFKSEFEQVIINLINNAKDAINKNNQKSGTIKINCKEIQKKIIIEIQDNGGGIAYEIMGKIFQPYFTTKFESQGTGLGLYMSKMIIEKNMGGAIKVSNHSDGALFELIFKG